MSYKIWLVMALIILGTISNFSWAQEIGEEEEPEKTDKDEAEKQDKPPPNPEEKLSDSPAPAPEPEAPAPVSGSGTGSSGGDNDKPKQSQAPKGGMIRFSDNWGAYFPKCNPSENQFLSPIDIDTSIVENYSKTTLTLMIYSYEPIKNYSLTTFYQDADGGVTMSALGFVVDKGIFFESTYINGCGMDEFLMFDRGAIFFSKKPLRPEQSMHRIDGKEYPMEVMLYFKDNYKSNKTREIKETAQIFILFKITEYDNPLFFPIIEAAKKMIAMKPKSIQVPRLEKEIGELEEKIGKMNETYAQGGLTSESLQKRLFAVTAAAKLRESTIDAKFIDEQELIDTQADLKVKGFEESLKTYTDSYEKAKSNLAAMTEKAASGDALAKKLLVGAKAEAEKLKNIKFYFQKETSILLRSIADLEARIEQFNKQIDEETQILANNEVGDGFELKNLTMFQDMLKTKLEMKSKIREQSDKLKSKKKELKELKETPGRKVKMNTFQVSWLMPEVGGYYAYNGSIPLPPCQRIRYSIVLEDQSYLSQEQFDLLASIPKFDDSDGVADQVAPVLQELNNRPIWYNHKNIQYQRDDGVHMKSIQKLKLKKAKKNGGCSIVGMSGIWAGICIILIVLSD